MGTVGTGMGGGPGHREGDWGGSQWVGTVGTGMGGSLCIEAMGTIGMGMGMGVPVHREGDDGVPVDGDSGDREGVSQCMGKGLGGGPSV